jgi:hypothetical protein
VCRPRWTSVGSAGCPSPWRLPPTTSCRGADQRGEVREHCRHPRGSRCQRYDVAPFDR